jgi:hypothetical protein
MDFGMTSSGKINTAMACSELMAIPQPISVAPVVQPAIQTVAMAGMSGGTRISPTEPEMVIQDRSEVVFVTLCDHAPIEKVYLLNSYDRHGHGMIGYAASVRTGDGYGSQQRETGQKHYYAEWEYYPLHDFSSGRPRF